jgi:predicted metal-dependent peptidase
LLREQVSDDWNWLKPNLCYEGSGFILPDLDGFRCGPIIFATDTSGSIDQEMLSHYQTEKQSCLDEMKPKKLVDIYCDATIQAVAEYDRGDVIKHICPGGGGTAFEPVFEYAEKLDEPPKCLVYLTDLYGSFPDKEPGYPVIWVTWTKDGKAPFGTTVYAGQ